MAHALLAVAAFLGDLLGQVLDAALGKSQAQLDKYGPSMQGEREFVDQGFWTMGHEETLDIS